MFDPVLVPAVSVSPSSVDSFSGLCDIAALHMPEQKHSEWKTVFSCYRRTLVEVKSAVTTQVPTAQESKGGAERRHKNSLDSLLGTVLLGVMLCGFFRMVCGMQVVTMGDVGMMSGFFVATAGVVLCRFFVMAGRMFMVLRRFCMMFCALVGHGVLRV